jgi:hypothetical protein
MGQRTNVVSRTTSGVFCARVRNGHTAAVNKKPSACRFISFPIG